VEQSTRSTHETHTKRSAHPPPSAPRAMAETNSRGRPDYGPTRERSPRQRRDRDRDQVLHQPSPKPVGDERKRDRTATGNSLRSRMNDDVPRGETPPSPGGLGTATTGDESKKRSFSEHSRGDDVALEGAPQPSKKPRRLVRTRYN